MKKTIKHTVSRLVGEFAVGCNKYVVDIPKGTACVKIHSPGASNDGCFWVDDLSWINPENRMLKHDAYFYGIILTPDQVK
jgi:hypothetical protein